MSPQPLTTLDAFTKLINKPRRPSVVLVHSKHCPPCVLLHPKLLKLVRQYPALTFYDLDVERFADPALDEQLTIILKSIELQFLPSQLLLSHNHPPKVICTQHINVIKDALAALR